MAREVDGLIIYSGNLNEFRAQICPLAEKWKSFVSDCKEYDRTRREHWEKVKANPNWQDKSAVPAEEGWEWDQDYLYNVGSDIGPLYEMPAKYVPAVMATIEEYIERNEKEIQRYAPNSAEYRNLQESIIMDNKYLESIKTKFEKLQPEQIDKAWINTTLDDNPPIGIVYEQLIWYGLLNMKQEQVFGCWRPPLRLVRPNPLQSLIPEERKKSLPPAESQDQEYERYYVVLTSIHDNILTGVHSISKGIWPAQLANNVWSCFTQGQPYGPDRPFIEVALESV